MSPIPTDAVSRTLVEITAGAGRARVTLAGGAIVPRLIERGPARARVALVAGGALLLGGDAIEVRLVVGAGCALEVEDIGGTVAYDGEGRRARWDARVDVGDGASLVWHALPFVVAEGADVDRTTSVGLGEAASVLLRETVVLGRVGERGGRIRTRTDVRVGREPLLIEGVDLDGSSPLPGVAGRARVLDTVFAHPARGGSADDRAPLPGSTVLRPEGGGVLHRALGDHAHLTDLGPVVAALAAEITDAPSRREDLDALTT